eukprot:jgi/Hompol1/3929/HPOL_006824-RA
MQLGRIDRERMMHLKEYLLLRQIVLPSIVSIVMSQFDHECSRVRAALLIAPGCTLEHEEAIVILLRTLRFYSDKVHFLQATPIDRGEYVRLLDL